MKADPDRIPGEDDPDAAAKAVRQARGQTVVLMAPNVWLPLPDAEVYALTAANQGSSTYVIGWRRARGPAEMAPHYQAAWSGDPSELVGELLATGAVAEVELSVNGTLVVAPAR